jgi:ABC-type bacteriocin/lantibiotic exporter with double-glycine peptidase domain
LSGLGFKASFGRLNIANLAEEFFPLIAFNKNGEAVVIVTAPVDGKIFITNPVTRKKEEISTTDYKSG